MKRYSARETLNKLRWHPQYDFSKVVIIYIDRFEGNKEIRAENIESIGHKFLYLKDGKVIPQHRIVEIRYGGNSVWKKS
ncbi:MAG: DUF504 domain-containing protein [Archaeoglobaceae archaeon]|nr:DUF504 domain-containing protein [Archaeoglobaceae archaeon]MDW7989480.1 DUF504 domain-containing protein [Archaeoglobaceae archaeon]